MNPRDGGKLGPVDAGIAKVSALAVALGVAGLAVTGALMVLSLCEGEEPAASAADSTAEAVGSGFSIDPDDARAMHDASLPTRSDVLGWHMCGRWGFPHDGEGGYEVHTFYDLPGGAWVWDALYGFDPNDPRFKFKQASPYEG